MHRATLPNGRRVAVKVQRPNAPRQIEADLALLYQAARLIRERVRALDFIDPRQLVDEFARSIRQELDYRLEARNAEAFHHRFSGHPHVRIPRVYWSYTRTRVLTLELLEGVQLADLPLDAWEMEERRRLAYLMAETWMTMIFRHGFFHGDPHPANILVLGDAEHIGLVDFGQVGKLTDDDMSKLTRLFIDAASEHIDALPRRLAELGVRYPKEREEEFVAELREMYARYYGASLAEIDPLQVIREAFQLIYRMNLRLPTRFVMLDKAIATLGSVGVELYPDFNVFEIAKPYARGLMLERYTPQRVLKRAQAEGLELARIARDLPYQVHDVLEELRDGQIEVGFVHKGLDEFMRKLDVAFNRLVIALVTVGGLIGSSLIGIFATKGPQIVGVNFLSFVGFVALGGARPLAACGACSAPAGCRNLGAVPRERTSGARVGAADSFASCRRRCSSPRPSREHESSSSGTWRATASRCSERTPGARRSSWSSASDPTSCSSAASRTRRRSRSAACCARASPGAPGTATCR